MTAGPADPPRVIVGVDDSSAARWALAWALGEARLRDLELLVVHVATVPAYAATAGLTGNDAFDGLRAAGAELIARMLDEVAGGSRAGVRTAGMALVGVPGEALTRLARPGDVLVVGQGRRGLLSKLVQPSVRQHCARRARATFVTVPAPLHAEAPFFPGEPEPAFEQSAPRRAWARLRRRATSPQNPATF